MVVMMTMPGRSSRPCSNMLMTTHHQGELFIQEGEIDGEA